MRNVSCVALRMCEVTWSVQARFSTRNSLDARSTKNTRRGAVGEGSIYCRLPLLAVGSEEAFFKH